MNQKMTSMTGCAFQDQEGLILPMGQERDAGPSHGSDADYRSSKRHKSAAEITPTPEHIQ